jgi:2,3-bisphosphoglycerate-independent phosphoglycerate mutase
MIDKKKLHLPLMLAILDGVGLAPDSATNALSSADTPFLDVLFKQRRYPYTELTASGELVGLPAGQMGNSEVGHLNIGAGRVVYQELSRINRAIADGSFYDNPAFLEAFAAVKASGGVLHLMGLVSDGGVHSELTHLEALLEAAARAGVAQVYVHVFLDGRDVPPKSGADYLRQLTGFLAQLAQAHPQTRVCIASLHGRYYAMDRDKRWDRLERTYKVLTAPAQGGSAYQPGADPVQLVDDSYARQVTDEFLQPVALQERGIQDGDAVIFFNFRPDRARELTRSLIDPAFDRQAFKRALKPSVHFVCMTEYDPEFEHALGAHVAFAKVFPDNVLADVLAAAGLRQLHIAETEKYAHVTFFFNGGIEEPKQREQRILVPSPKVATYDLQPQMSAFEVCENLQAAIEGDAADVYIVNFANGDMVGHTGNLAAAQKAVEVVDLCLQRVVLAMQAKGGVSLITADHGNCEVMVDDQGGPMTSHTTSKVPFVLVPPEPAGQTEAPGPVLRQDQDAKLADIAPTILELIGLPIPAEFDGKSLLQNS